MSLCDFEIIFGRFSKDFENGVCFQHVLTNIPMAPPRPEEGDFFQNMLKTDPLFQNILNICQISFKNHTKMVSNKHDFLRDASCQVSQLEAGLDAAISMQRQ